MVADGTSTLALALILGAMIGFDLGGPVNKSAWMAGNALFLSGVYLPAILVNIAIVIPPLGYGLATLIRNVTSPQPLEKPDVAALSWALSVLQKERSLLPLSIL